MIPWALERQDLGEIEYTLLISHTLRCLAVDLAKGDG